LRAVTFRGAGGVEVLAISEVPRPEPGPEELLVRVRAAALNRADTLQRSGEYQAPEGVSPIPGVEIAGEVAGWGEGVRGFALGDRVCGLVGGGGYAEYCPLDHQMALPVPDGWSFAEAVAVPEAFYTADTTLFEIGRLSAGETALIHAGGSGVGSACLQLARQSGARVLTTVGSREKAEKALALGAHEAILYKEQDFVAEVLRLTGGEGVDLVEDFVGGGYLLRNLEALKELGRLIQVGVLTENLAQIDLDLVLFKRLTIRGTVMRPLPLADKRVIAARFRRHWWPLFLDGRLRPVVDAVIPFEDVARAHQRMEADLHFGKIVLSLG
jgi:NADPH:quinone reductase